MDEAPTVFECDRCHDKHGKAPQIVKVLNSSGQQTIEWWCWSCAFRYADKDTRDGLFAAVVQGGAA